MATVRRRYKDSLFCHLFGSEERKANALELYNALAGTAHGDPGGLELTTIGDMVFLGFRNDVSFLVGDEMVLLEHQSTRNPNMPLRGLLYFSRLYSKLVDRRGLDLYGERRLELPAPRFFVLYFGRDDEPDRQVLRLSDSFPGTARHAADVEVTATVLNCSEGHNPAIMGASETLRGYAHLLALARANRDAGMGMGDAVSDAVDRCIAEGVLAAYLSEHRAEARDMIWTIEDEERAMRVHWECVAREATERGLAQGESKARAEIAASLRELGVDESVIRQAIPESLCP